MTGSGGTSINWRAISIDNGVYSTADGIEALALICEFPGISCGAILDVVLKMEIGRLQDALLDLPEKKSHAGLLNALVDLMHGPSSTTASTEEPMERSLTDA